MLINKKDFTSTENLLKNAQYSLYTVHIGDVWDMLNFFVILFLIIAIENILIMIYPEMVVKLEYELCFVICTIIEFVYLVIDIVTPTKTEAVLYQLVCNNTKMLFYDFKIMVINRVKAGIQQKKEKILKLPKFTSVEQLVKFVEEGTTDVA